jgi:hypothetical protein
VRHRVFGALGATCPANDVFDLRDLSQDVLYAVIQSVDFVQSRFRR